ncbi:NAD(P)/FAD-dependent oxidoreductase [Actinoplanes sp. NPDC004185]
MGNEDIVIVGAGFAGYHAARRLAKRLRGTTRITVLNPTDYFLYPPLLPEVAGGVLEPRPVTVPLADTLSGVRIVLGQATGIDPSQRRMVYRDPEGRDGELRYDRLLLTVGSVNKLLPVPGVADNAHGFRGLPEALYLRDHLIRQVEMAAASDDPAERQARCTVIVVGAGYTGTEVTAQGQLLTAQVAARHPRLAEVRPRWLLVDQGERILAHLDRRLSDAATRTLRERGAEIRTGTSIAEATAAGVHLDDGTFVASRTLVRCVGVRPDPLVETIGLPTDQGRLVVDAGLGFAVDLGGRAAAANPLGVALTGLPALAVTRGYHLAALPANHVRTTAAWLFAAAGRRPDTQLGLVPGAAVPLDTADPEVAHTGT